MLKLALCSNHLHLSACPSHIIKAIDHVPRTSMADNTPRTDNDSVGLKDWRSCLCRRVAISHHSSLLGLRLLEVRNAQLGLEDGSVRRGAVGSMPTADLIASVTVIVAIEVL